MNDMQIFQNNKFGQVRIIDRCGQPWFVAKDVAACIDYKDVSTMCKLCREKDLSIINGKEYSADLAEYSESRGNPNLTVISESGLYRILAKCNLPKCEHFESWVFDEVLPSIRKHGMYATDDFVQRSISDPDWAISMLQQLKFEREQKELALKQRDEAIATKSWIGSKREATAMNTASQKAKECEKLREQIGDAKGWKAVQSIRWLKDFFALSQGLYMAVADKLKKICIEFGLERHEIQDQRYGVLKTYPTKAIDILKERVEADPNMLFKYRKA